MTKKSKWPLGITIIYSLFAISLIGFAIFSGFNQVSLVSDNYYRESIEYQQQIERVERANEKTNKIIWKILENRKSIMLTFPKDSSGSKISGNIMFFRPSDAAQDEIVPLAISANNQQVVDLKKLSKGYWRIKIFWSKDNQEFYFEDKIVL